jgi:hypothetical protein
MAGVSVDLAVFCLDPTGLQPSLRAVINLNNNKHKAKSRKPDRIPLIVRSVPIPR